MTKARFFAFFPFMLLLALAGCTKCGGSAPSKRVFFISPKDGETVLPTFQVKFGVEGMTVRPALEDPNDKTSGHHHILIDDDKGYIEAGQVIPKDATHVHFGKGETETMLTLTPGTHKLSLQFADGAHLSYGKDMSASITVKVEAQAPTP